MPNAACLSFEQQLHCCRQDACRQPASLLMCGPHAGAAWPVLPARPDCDCADPNGPLYYKGYYHM